MTKDIEFIERESRGFKEWILNIDRMIPCSEEEKEIYGVEYKLDESIYRPFIVEHSFIDTGVYYESHAHGSGYGVYPYIFKELENAKEYVRKQYQENNRGGK